MRVSVIVPAHDQPDLAARALAAIAAVRPHELIVVVDGGDRRIVAVAEKAGATILSTPEPLGPAAARNLGARTATGDLLYFVDADVVIPPDALRLVTEAFAREPALAALIGSYDAAPADPHFFSQYRNLLHHWVHQTSRREAWTFWGGCGVIRRDVFVEVGGFDEGFREPAIEDIELGCRLVAGGHRILLLHELQVTHLKRWTLPSIIHTDLMKRAVPWTELILRGGTLRNDLNLRYRDRAGVVLVGIGGTALAATPAVPQAGAVAGLCAALLLAVNLPLYFFFCRRRGRWFAARAVPAHWLYLLVCGIGFVAGAARVAIRGVRRPAPAPRAAKVDREAA